MNKLNKEHVSHGRNGRGRRNLQYSSSIKKDAKRCIFHGGECDLGIKKRDSFYDSGDLNGNIKLGTFPPAAHRSLTRLDLIHQRWACNLQPSKTNVSE